MSNKAKVYTTNSEIDGGSILLLFKDGDAIIARNWQTSEKQMTTMTGRKPVTKAVGSPVSAVGWEAFPS